MSKVLQSIRVSEGRRLPVRALLVTICLGVAGCGGGTGTPIAPLGGAPSAMATPTESATASARPSATPSTTVSATPTATASLAPTATPSPTHTATPTAAPTPSATPSTAAVKQLWAIDRGTVVEFNSAQIASGTVAPIHQFSIVAPNVSLYQGMAFDRFGNLWIAEGNLTIDSSTGNYTGRAVEYSAAQLASLGIVPNPSPTVTLTLAGACFGLAFDGSGNLWTSVIGFSANSIEEFTVSQLAASAAPSPAKTIGPGGVPGGLAFASDGTLWYTLAGVFGPSGGSVYGLSAAELASSGSPAPAYALSADGPPLLGGQLAVITTPNEVTFDNAGSLWSAFNGFYFAFTASTLHSSGAKEAIGIQAYPAESYGTQTEVLPGYSAAFDVSGDLIGNSINNTTSSASVLKEYTAIEIDRQFPAALSAAFNASVPTDPTHAGNYIVAGPYVP